MSLEALLPLVGSGIVAIGALVWVVSLSIKKRPPQVPDKWWLFD